MGCRRGSGGVPCSPSRSRSRCPCWSPRSPISRCRPSRTTWTSTPAASIWVVNAYQLAVTVTLLPFASMGDIYGHRRVYIWGLAVYTAASLLCALAPSLPVLVIGRVLQGFGGAGIMSVNGALVRFIFPRAALGPRHRLQRAGGRRVLRRRPFGGGGDHVGAVVAMAVRPAGAAGHPGAMAGAPLPAADAASPATRSIRSARC